MLRTMIGAGVVLCAAAAAFAQTADPTLQFDVASIKPAAPPTSPGIRVMMRGGPGTPDPGQITYSNVTLKNVIMNAYDVKSYQVSGPPWLDSERYDIVAKIPKDTTKEQFRIMLQNMLTERFKLTLHHSSKEVPMYALVVGKGGPKMKEAAEDPATTAAKDAPKDAKDATGGPSAFSPPAPAPASGGGGGGGTPFRMTTGKDGMPQMPKDMAGKPVMMMMFNNGRFRMNATHQKTQQLAEMLTNQLGSPVTDQTGLTAFYDYTLEFAPDGGNPMGHMGMMMPPTGGGVGGGGVAGGGGSGDGPIGNASDASGPSIFTAVQEQLGLKLEQKKGPVDLLVIDHLEKIATEN